eukprot:6992008-Alexandrium_andersonii.AAC.1
MHQIRENKDMTSAAAPESELEAFELAAWAFLPSAAVAGFAWQVSPAIRVASALSSANSEGGSKNSKAWSSDKSLKR